MRAGSNTTAGHITVFDHALTQIPDPHRYGTASSSTPIRPAHLRVPDPHPVPAQAGHADFFSVGVAITEPVRAAAITAITDH